MSEHAVTSAEARINRLEQQARRALDDMAALKVLLEQNNTSLAEFIELAKVFKVGMKLLGWIERFAIFVTKLVVSGGALWATWKFLVKEAVAEVIRHIR